MKISYLITCSNETTTLENLLKILHKYKGNDEIVILHDNTFNEEMLKRVDGQQYIVDKEIVSEAWTITNKNKQTTYDIMRKYGEFLECFLNNDYGSHKNFGVEQCSGDFIFQIDADELPSELTIGDNLKSIIESNSDAELIFVPRLNDYIGVNNNHAKHWGWTLTNSNLSGICQGRPIVNFPDYQGRIFKNDYPRIHWEGKLHERIRGHNKYSFLPKEEEDYAIWHRKTIEKQIETNLRYNKQFTEKENKGHTVI